MLTSFHFVLAALISTFGPITTTAWAERPPAPGISNGTRDTTTLDRTVTSTSDLLLEYSATYQQGQLANVPAIPLAQNVSDYHVLSQLADLMPPLQVSVDSQDDSKMLEALSNATWACGPTADDLAGRQAPLRVIIVGDSMSQGQQGDWTWRYRIWEWFQAQGVAVDFVGPYSGTVQPDTPSAPSPPPLYGEPVPTPVPKTCGGYAVGVSADFDSDHFAVWGRNAAVAQTLIHDVVASNMADLMLLMIGFNDLGWPSSKPPRALYNVEMLVANARAANPYLGFAIADIPQRTIIGGRGDLIRETTAYNKLLPDAIARWTTAQSPVHLVQLQEHYDCAPTNCPAGYDGLHPNALGEYQIARAFTRTLVNHFKIGIYSLQIPRDLPSRPLPVPSNLQVFTSPGGVTATWDAVYGAIGYDIRTRISGLIDFSTGSVSSNRWDSQWSIDGWTYEFQVRSSAGISLRSEWTAVGFATAHPHLAPGPVNIDVRATETGMNMSWDPPTGPYTDSIIEYNILYMDQTELCGYLTGAAFINSPVSINGLKPGHIYFVAILTWNDAGMGFPRIANSVIVGAGTPETPTGLVITAFDAHTIHMTWDASADAAGYRIWSRSINDAGSRFQPLSMTVDMPCHDQSWLFPHAWDSEWSISAFNGNDESPLGAPAVAPAPGSDAPGPRCPSLAPWCPRKSSTTLAAVSTPLMLEERPLQSVMNPQIPQHVLSG